MEKPKVYFTRDLSPAGAIRAFDMLGIKLEGNVAVKLHSGEPGNQNFLRPAFMKDIVEHVNGTIVECNTAYDGGRNTTEAHKKTMLLHGWTEIADVDGSHIFTFTHDFDPELARRGYFTVDKGSVTVNGVSLTVCEPTADSFKVCIIPYTFEHTNFHAIGVGTKVNIEYDILGKYISRLQELS